jgi:hypothetical protein
MVLAGVTVHAMTGGCVVVGLRQDIPLRAVKATLAAHASDLTDAEHTRGPQDELRRDSDADARPCHGRVCQPLCLGPGGVTLVLSPGRTRPTPLGVQANVLSCRHTRHPRLGVTLGDSGSVGHAFLLEWQYRNGG